MFPFDADCSYCCNLDPNNEYQGKFWCREKKQYISANGSLCPKKHEVMGRPDSVKKALRNESKRHGYYIVTAITEILGLDRNNQYLNSFIELRDFLLPNMVCYEEFIDDYDTFGPWIADRLREDPYNQQFVKDLIACYLERFVTQFEASDIDSAFATYSEMYEQLKTRYGLSQKDNKKRDLVCKSV